jgi:hypothetical protein
MGVGKQSLTLRNKMTTSVLEAGWAPGLVYMLAKDLLSRRDSNPKPSGSLKVSIPAALFGHKLNVGIILELLL